MPSEPRQDIDDDADFAVVGSGAAGSTAARWLATSGRSVVVVEEGGPSAPAPFESAAALAGVRDAGLWHADGGDDLTLVAGRGLGGSTAISYGVHQPLAEETFRRWTSVCPTWAAVLPYSEMAVAHERVDGDLRIAKTPAALWGTSGRLLMAALPATAGPTWRSVTGCRGSGRCLAGCPTRAMASADRALLPIATSAGARVHTGARVTRIAVRDGRATGLIGVTSSGGTLRVHARRAVFLCAGAVHSTWLLARSGVPAASRGLQVHAEAWVSALLRDDVEPTGAGMPVSAHVPGVDRARVAAAAVLPRHRGAQLPGAGQDLEARLDTLGRVVTWQVAVACDAVGRVGGGARRPAVALSLLPSDRARVHAAVTACAAAMLNAGAVEVYPQVAGAPPVVADAAGLAALAERRGGAVPMRAGQLFGAVACDERFQVGGVRGLVCPDAAILPGPTVATPVATVMATSMAATQRWL